MRTTSGTVTVFLAHYRGRAYDCDVEPVRRGAAYRFAGGFQVDQHIRPLEDLAARFPGEAVSQVFEFVVAGQATPQYVDMSVKHAMPVTKPLPKTKQKRDDGADAEEDDDAESTDSLELELRKKIVDSDTSEASADTDADTDVESNIGVGCGLPEEEPEVVEDAAPDSGDDADEEPEGSDAEDGGGAKLYRHPLGTWKVWDSLWFYITQTPGWVDVKAHMKSPFRDPLMMGKWDMSKTLRPHHFGETTLGPARTKLLLRAWTVWRPKRLGWAAARESRLRHLRREEEKLVRDILETDGRERPTAPLLQNEPAHAALLGRVPHLVERILRPAA